VQVQLGALLLCSGPGNTKGRAKMDETARPRTL
jgi:hypothetical protein